MFLIDMFLIKDIHCSNIWCSSKHACSFVLNCRGVELTGGGYLLDLHKVEG